MNPYDFFTSRQLGPPCSAPGCFDGAIGFDARGSAGLRERFRAARKNQRGLYAFGTATAFHLVLAVLLLATPGRAPFGAAGDGLGTGIQVSLVSGFAGGAPSLGRPRAEMLLPPHALAEAEPERTADGGDDAPKADSSASQSSAQPPPTAGSAASGRDGAAGGLATGAQGATNWAGGDPLATSDLLAQIARCLDPGFRPALAYAQLTLQIGPDGRLQRPPQVASTLPSLGGDRAVADRIVQAALLCGPYDHPDLAGRTVSLAADFSRVGALP